MHIQLSQDCCGPVHRNWAFLIIEVALALILVGWLTIQTTPTVFAQTCPAFPNPQARFGYNVARDNGHTIDSYNVAPLKAQWYLDYFTQRVPSQPAGMRYAQMIRPPFWRSAAMTTTVEAILADNPGALWIVGNEPDRDKQDGLTPTAYATFYHDVYHFLKARDPGSHVAIAGVVQSTPLRRRYLDMVLTAYQSAYGSALPVDVWTMHAFILPENDQWGASIPPGLEEFADEGMQYDVWSHADLDIFKANILAFRQWMATNGYRDKALLVTEYGILLPDIAFPHAVVRDFMIGSFDYFLGATDDTVGYPADDNRLVQSWSWFSLNYPPYDPETQQGHNGNLVEPNSGLLLELGRDYAAYITAHQAENQLSLAVTEWQVKPPLLLLAAPDGRGAAAPITPVASDVPPTITVQGTLRNQGRVAGCNLQLQLWQQDPTGTSSVIDRRTVAVLAAGASQPLSFSWQPTTLTPGAYDFWLTVSADNADLGLASATADRATTVLALQEPNAHFGFLPLLQRSAASR